ncbi:hypothetical protein GTA08_BOTSDO01299 [Neofusicoccum parvum]|uniref:Uncharacterized protein n=1 Tax=Neofusicoccum parvum TaxID=310453 RepID=A0ACB5RY02_9PEZI|nr:hypothetical protein GTA08_BOTSDO01299 [Neofusicoccum parvum]
MTTFMPVSAAFTQHADVWVDKAWGFMIGWNFFLFQALLIPFEITAFDSILTFWRNDIPSAAVISACIVLYGITNVLAVRYFGEAEFWLCLGKLFLMMLLFSFTFVTMCGGNPQGHAYGFSNWSKPYPFLEYLSTDSWLRCGRLHSSSSTLRAAFKQVYWRFGIFFICGALCVGIVVPANDPTLFKAFSTGDTGTGASSPYVIAMKNMEVAVLPHIVNALLMTSVYSAGNCYVYTTCRSLHSLASRGHAPKFFLKTTRKGVPMNTLVVALAFASLSYLKLNSGSLEVLIWLANLITGGTIVTYIAVCVNYIFFYRALKAQKYDRDALPYKGWFQPYAAWVALAWLVFIELFYGYAVFLDGNWDTGSFFTSYTMCFIAICNFSSWKLLKRTKFVKPAEADLVWARPEIDRHEALFAEAEDYGFWKAVRHFLRFQKVGRSSKSKA